MNLVELLPNYTAENPRQPVRKDMLRSLRDKADILSYEEPAPTSPHYWALTRVRTRNFQI
ncbi:hypothetical protein SAMN06264855_12717 [Halorubrum vacuolatum]|uniref:Uncharacterized protein n=1 Tax=Halorubrum vacuolatum TaxID=63740 RepID=A0A238Y280_HALVU|nr:hypothetical protein SAMN06264855_12717 [Halorubrum vacuolatum]